MISSQDRSFYIGASDTSMVVGNWNTKTFEKWWLEKLGLNKNDFTNEAMQTGTNYEHKILEALEIKELEINTYLNKELQLIIDNIQKNNDKTIDFDLN